MKKRIRIIECKAIGKVFMNATPDSIHDLIETPPERANRSETWIMGVGEPIRLLAGEFEKIK